MTPIRTALIVIALACAATASAVAKSAATDATPPTVALDVCSWNRPGVNPFTGDVVAAVDRYRDIPLEVRERLKARMAKREYDDLVSIRRDSIDGRAGQHYGSTIRDMHFGTDQLCRSVTRKAWTPAMQERGLVYCEGGHCILVPTVCRNVSRISRKAVSPDHAEAPDDLDAVPPPGAVLAGPVGSPTPAPMALDEAPSFASPLAWSDPTAGWLGGANPPGRWGVGDAGPNVGPSATPPHGLDGSPPISTPIATPVPEPQTWALLLGGLAALALFARRRAVTRRAVVSDTAR
ncbi:MAG: MHFG family PEP-CTERM protein [Pseudomonadota bacterium]